MSHKSSSIINATRTTSQQNDVLNEERPCWTLVVFDELMFILIHIKLLNCIILCPREDVERLKPSHTWSISFKSLEFRDSAPVEREAEEARNRMRQLTLLSDNMHKCVLAFSDGKAGDTHTSRRDTVTGYTPPKPYHWDREQRLSAITYITIFRRRTSHY